MERNRSDKWTNQLFFLTENIEISLISATDKDLVSNAKKNLKYQDKAEELIKDGYKVIKLNNQIVLLNGMACFLYVIKLFETDENIKEEIEKNIQTFYLKHEAINYLEALKFKIDEIVEYFEYKQALWSEGDFSFLFYVASFLNEEIKDIKFRELPSRYIAFELGKIFELNHEIISSVQRFLNNSIKKTKNIPEKYFRKIPGYLLALLYYFLIKAEVVPEFEKGRKIEAMKEQLEKDGYEYSESFRRSFSAIGNGTEKDPMNIDNLQKILKLTKDHKAQTDIQNEIDYLYSEKINYKDE